MKLHLETIAEDGAQALAAVSAPAIRRKLRLAWIAASLAGLVAIAFIFLYISSRSAPGVVVRTTIEPPEKGAFYTGGLTGGPPALSPDGTKVAFIARSADGRISLWVRLLSSLESRNLSGTDEASLPFWSPDSQHLGFFSGSKLKRIDFQGGPPQTLAGTTAARGASWGRDGTILFAPGPNSPLWRVPASGGYPRQLTTLGETRQDTSHRWPQFLPDGKHFLFWLRTGRSEANGTYVASLDDPTPKLILRGNEAAFYASPGYLLFTREGTLLAQRFDAEKLEVTGEPQPLAEHVRSLLGVFRSGFTASEHGEVTYQPGETGSAGWDLNWVDRTGKTNSTVLRNEIILWPKLSPDGRRLAAQINDVTGGNADIWVIDLASAARTRLTFDPAVEQAPVWSPDGARVAFRSTRSAAGHIFEKRADGTGQEQALFAGDSSDLPLSWSADGKVLAFRRLENNVENIWMWPNFGERKPFPFLQDNFNKDLAQFSPDGKWLAYQSDESGRFEVYVVPFPNAQGRWQISSNGGGQPRWRSDGKELFFLGPQGKLMVAEVKETGSSLQTGNARPVLTIHPPLITGFFYDIPSDAKRFLVIQGNESTTGEPLVLIQNWPELLKKY